MAAPATSDAQFLQAMLQWGPRPHQLGRRLGLGYILHALPAFALKTVTRARALVVVAIIDAAQHVQARIQDGGGLQIVPQHPLSPHLQQVLGNVGKAGAIQHGNDIQHRLGAS